MIPRAKGGARLQMKLVYNHLAPLFLFLLQWMDCSCTCLLPRYLDLFHILIYKVPPPVRRIRNCPTYNSLLNCLYMFIDCPSCFCQVYSDGRPNISTHGRKATIRDFYGMSQNFFFILFEDWQVKTLIVAGQNFEPCLLCNCSRYIAIS